MWNNGGITGRAERQRIRFLAPAVLTAARKQRHYSCPNFSANIRRAGVALCSPLFLAREYVAADAESIKQYRVG